MLILLLIGLITFGTCAGQRTLVTPQKTVSKEPNPRAINHFIDGVIFDLNQNYAAALLAYQEALLYDSSASTIYLAIAKDYLRLGKEESAIISLKKCLDWNPREIEALEIMAKIYVAQRKWNLAKETYREIVAKDSLQLNAYYSLALLHLQRDEKEQAAELYRQILSIQYVPDPQILIDLGELYIDMKRYEDASEVFLQLIDADSAEGFGYYGLGMAREALGDTSRAIESYTKAIQLNPELIPARDRLSRIYASQENWEAALQVFTEAIQRDSTDLASWLALGETYRFSGDSTTAVETLQKIKIRFPKDWRAYLGVGRIFLDQQRFADAYLEFKTITQLSSKTREGWLFTGISLVHLDSLEQSQSYLQRALELAPRDPLGNYYLGSVLSQLNRPNEAVSYLELCLEIRPRWVAAMSALASAFESLKDYPKADSYFKEALQLDPENALVLNNYGYSLSERGVRLEEAMEMAQKALEKEPKNGAYLDTMGWIYYKMGEYEKALEYIEEAHSIRKSVEVAKHLGDVYDKLGMRQKAIAAWEKALELDQHNPEILKRLGQKIEE